MSGARLALLLALPAASAAQQPRITAPPGPCAPAWALAPAKQVTRYVVAAGDTLRVLVPSAAYPQPDSGLLLWVEQRRAAGPRCLGAISRTPNAPAFRWHAHLLRAGPWGDWYAPGLTYPAMRAPGRFRTQAEAARALRAQHAREDRYPGAGGPLARPSRERPWTG